jgi:hypothetical protein
MPAISPSASSRWSVSFIFCGASAASIRRLLATVLRYVAIALALVGLGLLVVGGRIGLVLMAASLGYPLWRRWQARRQLAGIGSPRAIARESTRPIFRSASIMTPAASTAR